MKVFNIILNIVIKLLTMLLSITYGIGIIYYFHNSPLFVVLGWILSIFIFMTSFVDMIRIKQIDFRTNILNFTLILLMLVNIYRPFFDSLLLDNLVNSFEFNASFSLSILHQNILLVTLFMIILFIINFKFKTKS